MCHFVYAQVVILKEREICNVYSKRGWYWHDIHVGLPQLECEKLQSKLSGNLVYGIT